jgi:hypothetical protein
VLCKGWTSGARTRGIIVRVPFGRQKRAGDDLLGPCELQNARKAREPSRRLNLLI